MDKGDAYRLRVANESRTPETFVSAGHGENVTYVRSNSRYVDRRGPLAVIRWHEGFWSVCIRKGRTENSYGPIECLECGQDISAVIGHTHEGN